MSEETGRAAQKRELEEDASSSPGAAAEPEAKRAKVEVSAAAAVDLAKVKRQVEYYLSDENLKYDQFFHPIISNDPERWLPMGNILSCKRIQNLKATAEDIVAALKDSSHLEIAADGASYKIRRVDPAPLPPLEQRPPRHTADRRGGDRGEPRSKGAADLHTAGVMVKLEGIPTESSWETLKTALAQKLPTPPAPPAGPDGKERKPYSAIQFISRPTPSGTAVALLQPFENDLERLTSGEEFGNFEIDNGVQVKVSVLTDWNEAQEFLRSLPQIIRKKREREITRKKREVSNKPILMGGNTFQSIEHLRRCLKEVQTELAPGKVVNAKTSAVLKDLLGYHPNGQSKLKDLQEFKVDVQTFPGNKGEQTAKCFFVVRTDGSTEDFSVQKCFAQLLRNPPFANTATPTPAEEKENTA